MGAGGGGDLQPQPPVGQTVREPGDLQELLGNLLEALTRSLTVLISTFGVLFIATYLLIDVPRFRQTFVNAFAVTYRPDAEQLWTTIGLSLSRYLGGLLVSIPAEKGAVLEASFAGSGLALARIGRVVDGTGLALA